MTPKTLPLFQGQISDIAEQMLKVDFLSSVYVLGSCSGFMLLNLDTILRDNDVQKKRVK